MPLRQLLWLPVPQSLFRAQLVEAPEWFGIREQLFHGQLLLLAWLSLRLLVLFALLVVPQEPFLRPCEPFQLRPLLLLKLALQLLWRRQLLQQLLGRALELPWRLALHCVLPFLLPQLRAWLAVQLPWLQLPRLRVLDVLAQRVLLLRVALRLWRELPLRVLEQLLLFPRRVHVLFLRPLGLRGLLALPHVLLLQQLSEHCLLLLLLSILRDRSLPLEEHPNRRLKPEDRHVQNL